MNTLQLLTERGLDPRLLAFFPLDGKPTYFGELMEFAGAAQANLVSLGLSAGDSVLVADSISAEFYACVMAILGLGATVILVEPFLPLHEIEEIITSLKPKVLIASLPGCAWGSRVSAIRKIPHWRSARKLCSARRSYPLSVSPVSPDFPGIITFSSGTTGKSKGVVRTHSGLSAQNHVIRNSANLDQFKAPDLAIFANLVLANLGMGRGTVFVPPRWKKKHLEKLKDLPKELQPETLSCGPAFFEKLLDQSQLPDFKSIHLGGALSDCRILEAGFKRFSRETRFLHVYGSSEAEPVSFIDARVAVEESRKRDWFQMLLLGDAVPEIETQFDSKGLWVTGAHVCRSYIGNEAENRISKRQDELGRTWHFMGDRIEKDHLGLWYKGRAFQRESDFLLEQKIYAFLNSSRSFLFRNQKDHLILSGEQLRPHAKSLINLFPEIHEIQEKKIIRDRRHRARIDRGASQ